MIDVGQVADNCLTASRKATALDFDFALVDVCRGFDRAWRDGSDPPSIRQTLDSVEPPLLIAAFRELVAIDWERRISAGESPDIESYRQQFPELSGELDDTFAQQLDDSAADEPGELPSGALKTIGEYRIVREVGRGGMGIVYAARQESLNRTVAIKVLPQGAVWDEIVLRRFQREAEANARLRHPHIVPVFGVGQDDGVHYFVMDLIEGRSLALRAGKSGQPKMPDSESQATTVARIGQHVADALHYAHEQGILHRDVKPSNLLLDKDNHVWLTDFGLAGNIDGPSDLTETGAAPGTLRFMPPERIRDGSFDTRSDVYCLGLTLYELLASRPAFDAKERSVLASAILEESPHALRKLDAGVPRDLDTIVQKAIAHDPERRYQTAGEMADDLQRFLEDRPITARRVSFVERTWRWCRRKPAQAGVIAATLMIVLMAIVGGGWIRHEQLNRQRQAAAEVRDLLENARLLLSRVRARAQPGPAGPAVIRPGRIDAFPSVPGLNKLRVRGGNEKNSDVLMLALDRVSRARQLLDAETGGRADRRAAERMTQDLQTELRQQRLVEQLNAAQHIPSRFAALDPNMKSLGLVPLRGKRQLVSTLYAKAFAGFGLPATSPPEEAAARISELEPWLRHEVIVALNLWFHSNNKKEFEETWISEVLVKVDSDAWRQEFRDSRRNRGRQTFQNLLNNLDTSVQDPRIILRLVNGLPISTKEGKLQTELMRRALISHPMDYWLNQCHAVSRLRARQVTPEVVQCAAVAYALRPCCASMTVLAAVLQANGQPAESERLVDRIRQLWPDESQPAVLKSRLLAETDDVNKSIEGLRTLADQFPDVPAIHLVLGVRLREAGLAEPAEAAFRRSLALNDEPGNAAVELAELLRQTGRETEAGELLQRCVERLPKSVEELELLYAALGDAALDDERALVGDKLVRMLMSKTKKLQARHRFPQAALALRRVMELSPDHRQASKMLDKIENGR